MGITHRSPEQIGASSALDNDWWLALAAIEAEASEERSERDASRKAKRRKWRGGAE